MTDVTDTTDNTTQPKEAPSTTLLTRIESNIKTAQDGGVITDRVVDVFAERELKRRTDLIVQGVDVLTAATKSYGDINKTDQEHFTSVEQGANSRVVSYSKKRVEEIAKAKKTLGNVAKALDDAITKASFDNLEKVLKNKGKPEEDKAA